eukprot:82268-Pyramimonas_sp.AAC.1
MSSPGSSSYCLLTPVLPPLRRLLPLLLNINIEQFSKNGLPTLDSLDEDVLLARGESKSAKLRAEEVPELAVAPP